MAAWIVMTTVLAAAATFLLGWRVGRRRFLGRALDAERQYRALVETSGRYIAQTRTQIQALNDRIALLNKHTWWGANERRRLAELASRTMAAPLGPNSQPTLPAHGFADTIPGPSSHE